MLQSLLLRLSYHTPVQLGKSQKKKEFHFSESCGRLVSEKWVIYFSLIISFHGFPGEICDRQGEARRA